MANPRRKRKVWPWVLLAVVIVIAVLWSVLANAAAKLTATPYINHTVTSRDISVSATGSGRLASAHTTDIELPEGVIVAEVNAKVGDRVEAGDVLAILDEESLALRAAELSDELTALDRQLNRSTVSAVYAPVKGRVKQIAVDKGDDVVSTLVAHGMLALLSADGLMQVEIVTDAQLPLYATVRVAWEGGAEDGEIAKATANGYLITLDDETAPYLAMADVFDADGALLGSGMLEIHQPVGVFGTGGTIETIHCKVGDSVTTRSKLFTLDHEPASAAYTKALASRNDKAEEYTAVLLYQRDPRVLATESGVISSVAVSEGKAVAAATTTGGMAVAFTANTVGELKMSVEIDELDINSIVLGQVATVTMDAFPSETFEARVTHLSRIGQASGSITTYAVELTLSYDERLFEGMNGSAVITTNLASGVLCVPIDAIGEDKDGSYVYVVSGESVTKVYITTGLSDGTNAEVTGGLAAGDVVQYVDTSANANAFMMMRMGGMQNMGGGSSSRGN